MTGCFSGFFCEIDRPASVSIASAWRIGSRSPTDKYSGTIHEAACRARARRKIRGLYVVCPNAVTEEALRRIDALYEIEEQIRGKPPDERHNIRQARAVPLLDDMKRWFDATLTTLSAKSDTTKAIRYALNRWPSLIYCCSDGRTEIDNLIAERALRGVAIGRRNYLFAGADTGGERAAAMYSLSGTVRMNRLDPEAYLSCILTQHGIARPVRRSSLALTITFLCGTKFRGSNPLRRQLRSNRQ